MAPAFVYGSVADTPNKQDTVVVGQKNGNLYALSAIDGSTLWATVTSPDGTEGGLSWGVAVDDVAVYFTGEFQPEACNSNEHSANIATQQSTITACRSNCRHQMSL